MSCCGQKRLALLQGRTGELAEHVAPSVASPVAPAQLRGGEPRDVMLRYLGIGSFATRSVSTGRGYVCAGTETSVAVDPRDVETLLRTRRFTRL
jgi:hypothetical protein